MPEHADQLKEKFICESCADGDHDECWARQMEGEECSCRPCREEDEARAEEMQQREIENYYGGDGIRSYGPSDPKGW